MEHDFEEEFFLRIEGKGAEAFLKEDAVLRVWKRDHKWKESVVHDPNGLLERISSSPSTYMGYLGEDDIIKFIEREGQFTSVQRISKEQAVALINSIDPI